MEKGRANLGYREVRLTGKSVLGPAGQSARGHEFHYSRIAGTQDKLVESIYSVRSASGEDLGSEGYHIDNALGSYTHIHFGSNPAVARAFTAFAAKSRAGKVRKA